MIELKAVHFPLAKIKCDSCGIVGHFRWRIYFGLNGKGNLQLYLCTVCKTGLRSIITTTHKANLSHLANLSYIDTYRRKSEKANLPSSRTDPGAETR